MNERVSIDLASNLMKLMKNAGFSGPIESNGVIAFSGTIEQNLPDRYYDNCKFKKPTKPNLTLCYVSTSNQGGPAPLDPSPAREAKRVPSEMAVVSFVQQCPFP